ncbi:ribonuclease H-like domain-containing protein [Xylariomycetidae sp. FL0641]|nr:ribonuclease H-like domain-containing protein [Xylariomycetidae sp. FL0641]
MRLLQRCLSQGIASTFRYRCWTGTLPSFHRNFSSPTNSTIFKTYSFPTPLTTGEAPFTPETAIISSTSDLKSFLSHITRSSSLYIDLEGRNLGRSGTICLLAIIVQPGNQVRLIDVQTLGPSCFDTKSDRGLTLKSILEHDDIPKYFWDVRADADALWALYNVRLAGVTDLQLMENAAQKGDRKLVRRLEQAIGKHLGLGTKERVTMLHTKKAMKPLMASDIFAERPLTDKVIQYCINDIRYLMQLRNVYEGVLSQEWRLKVAEESARRLDVARSPDFNRNAPGMGEGPWYDPNAAVAKVDDKAMDLDNRGRIIRIMRNQAIRAMARTKRLKEGSPQDKAPEGEPTNRPS